LIVAIFILILLGSTTFFNQSSFAGRGNLRFIVLSDLHIGGSSGNYRPVVEKVVDRSPDFVILSGDMVFSNGYNQTEWDILWNETLLPLRNNNIPIYPVIGNHDSPYEVPLPLWKNISWDIDVGKGWYSFIVSNVNFVIVENSFHHTWNCNEYDPYGYVTEQIASSESALQEDTHWTFLISHKGAYWNTTAHPQTWFGINDSDYICNQQIFNEWLTKYKIDMFISGHQHMTDTYYQNGTIYSHIPSAYDPHSAPPYQRGDLTMFDVYAPVSPSQRTYYPYGYLEIRHIDYEGFTWYNNVFKKNIDFLDINDSSNEIDRIKAIRNEIQVKINEVEVLLEELDKIVGGA